MEIKKPALPVATIIQRNESAETEKKSVKSSALGFTSVKDGFEVKNNNSGLFTESRLGQLTVENSGKKELSPAEQQEAFKFNYKDFKNFKNSNSSSSSQHNQDVVKEGRTEGNKQSGQGEGVDSRTKALIEGRTADSSKDLNSPLGSERTNDAVKQLTSGTNLREFLNQEVAERHQELNKLGGKSPLDRIASSLDPAASTQPNEKPFGRDQLAYERSSERKNKDGSTTHVTEITQTFGNGTIQEFSHEKTEKKDGTEYHEIKITEYRADNSKKEYTSKENYDNKGNMTATSTTTTTDENGNVTTSTTTTTKKKDGSETTTTKTTTTPGGGTKSYDPDNYTGNIPEEIKRTMDYFKEQARKLRPSGGGERVLTDGGAVGTPVASGPADNISPKFGGITGMVGQPNQGENEIGNGTGFESVSNADAHGGAINNGENNWTGRTIQDDPADVHFGPAEQPKKKAEDEESDDSSKLIFDLLRRKKA